MVPRVNDYNLFGIPNTISLNFLKELGSREPLGKLQADNFSILVAAFRESKLSGIPLLEFSRIVHFFVGIRQSSTLQSASLTPHVPSSHHFQQAYCISLT